MQDSILSIDLRRHVKNILIGNLYLKKSLDGIDDQVSMLIANFEKNVSLNKKYSDLKTRKGDSILFNKKAWNDWCDLDKLRSPLKLPIVGFESKATVGNVMVKTSTASKKGLIKHVHELDKRVNELEELIRNLDNK